MYANGEGVPRDYRAALKWYLRAAEQGVAQAQSSLGGMYTRGEGVPKDYVRAYAWLNLAVAQGETGSAEVRDKLQSSITTNQILRAQQLSTTLFSRINKSR